MKLPIFTLLALMSPLTHAENSPAALRKVPFSAIQALPSAEPDLRSAYGEAPLQFGELWLPKGTGKAPVVLFVHGGCWQNAFGIDHVRPLCASLRSAGFAVWSVEYRRIGDEGGAWPGTFLDVARAADHLRTLAGDHPIDLARVVAAGHSAGGHLALWLASRGGLEGTELAAAGTDPLPLRGVLGLAAITDLAAYSAGSSGCERSTLALLGGTPEEQPARYALTSPAARPPHVPVRLLQGLADTIVSEAQARALGGAAIAIPIADAGHFDLIHPGSAAFPEVLDALRSLLQ